MDLSDKVAVITGGARGLGKGFADRILQRGGTVVLVDIITVEGQNTSEYFNNRYGPKRALFLHCDVTKKEDLIAVFETTKHQFGNIDIVINNAGVSESAGLRKVIDINLTGVIEGTNLAVQYMKKDNGGRGGLIVNIGSSAGLIPVPWPIYAASKTGVVGLTRSLAGRSYDTTDQGIRVTCLCPSLVDTDLLNKDDQHYKNSLAESGLMQIDRVADALINLVDNPSNNGGIYTVTPKIMRYKYPYQLRGKL